MYELVKAGGWVMVPILACSVLALAIILERAWALRRARVLPPSLVADLRHWAEQGGLQLRTLDERTARSPLGRVVFTALANRHLGREVVKESIEDTGRHIVFELERFLNTLGTIATIAPLLGLLGTVTGIIASFQALEASGAANDAAKLAGGIWEALLCTGVGLSMAIPFAVLHSLLETRLNRIVAGVEDVIARVFTTELDVNAGAASKRA